MPQMCDVRARRPIGDGRGLDFSPTIVFGIVSKRHFFQGSLVAHGDQIGVSDVLALRVDNPCFHSAEACRK